MITPYSFAAPEAHAQFVEDIKAGKLFTSSNFPGNEAPDAMLNVFRPVVLALHRGDFRHADGTADMTSIGGVFEYWDRAAGTVKSPKTGKVYPVFETCYVVRLEEWIAMGRHLASIGVIDDPKPRITALVLPKTEPQTVH